MIDRSVPTVDAAWGALVGAVRRLEDGIAQQGMPRLSPVLARVRSEEGRALGLLVLDGRFSSLAQQQAMHGMPPSMDVAEVLQACRALAGAFATPAPVPRDG